MSYRVEATSVDRKGNPKRKFTFFGKNKQAALSNAKGYFRKTRNIKAGFYDEDGEFHPIRASSDYSPTRAGDKPPKKRSTARRRRRKHNRRRRNSPVIARTPVRRRRRVRRNKRRQPAALARYWRKRRAMKSNRRRNRKKRR